MTQRDHNARGPLDGRARRLSRWLLVTRIVLVGLAIHLARGAAPSSVSLSSVAAERRRAEPRAQVPFVHSVNATWCLVEAMLHLWRRGSGE